MPFISDFDVDECMSCYDEIDIYHQNLANNNSVSKFQEMFKMIKYGDENTDINQILMEK